MPVNANMFTGTGTGSTPGSGGSGLAAGTDPLSGFAQRYNPSILGQTIWESPWAILPDVFPGIKPGFPGYQALRDLGADPLTLYNIIAGAGNDLTGAGVGGYTNWLASLYGSMGQPGGRAFNARELLGNIFGQEAGLEADSALGRIMGAGDMGTQVRTLFNLLREATNAGMNPLASRGYQASVAQAGDLYQNQMLNSSAAQTPQFHEWLRQKYPALAGR